MATPSTALPHDIEWRLPRHPRSVGRARTLLREQARMWKLPDDVTETAVLLLSAPFSSRIWAGQQVS